MKNFRPNVTRIKGLSDQRRMPLLNKIRLGIKKKSKSTGAEYPYETDYFVCPPEVQAFFGEQPKKLVIMFPVSDIESVFPCAYIFYGKSKGVKCKGDGEKGWRMEGVIGEGEREVKEMVEIKCPCDLLEAGKCKKVGRLLFMIPKVSVAGVYQLSTSSYNSIIDIQSGLDYVERMVGRFAFIELELKRIPTVTHHDEKRQTHYTLQILLPEGIDMQALANLRADNERIFTQAKFLLPQTIEENPEMDAVDVVEDEEDTESDEAEVVEDVPENLKPVEKAIKKEPGEPSWVTDEQDEEKEKEEEKDGMMTEKQRGDLFALMPKEWTKDEMKKFFDFALGKGEMTKVWAKGFIDNFDFSLKSYLKHIMTKGKSTPDKEDKFAVKKAVKEAHDNDFDNMVLAMEAMGLSEKLPTGIKANIDLWEKYQEIINKSKDVLK